jgi:hypothetical protein
MTGSSSPPWQRWLALSCLLGAMAMVLLHSSSDAALSQRRSQSTQEGSLSHETVEDVYENVREPASHRRLDTLDPKDLMKQFNNARKKVYDKLRKDYGSENFDNMFFVTSKLDNKTLVPRPVVVGPTEEGLSRRRLINKLLLKILNAKQKGANLPFVWAVSETIEHVGG